MKIANLIIQGLFISLVNFNVSQAAAQQNMRPTPDSGTVSIQIDNVVGDKPLKLNDETYTNEAGEKFSITTFNYFISNIIFTDEAGQQYVVPQDQSYFLLKAEDSLSHNFKVSLPDGKYNSITFTIGVDSVRNTMDVSKRTGVLDISGGMLSGMYWTWNSGYIFLKLEGMCDQADVDRTGQRKFRYHIGGYGGYHKPSLNNIKTVTMNFTKAGTVIINKDRTSKVLMQADILKIFNGNTQVSIAKNSAVMFGDFSSKVAENYTHMFRYVSTSN